MNANQVVLYAEDDDNDIFFMERAFRQAGVVQRLEVVKTGSQAIQYLSGATPYADREAHPLPCLLLVDLSMPGKSGHEVIKWVRSTPMVCTLPVIVLTSSNQESDIHRAYILGANGYLIKPGKPEELLAMVRGVKEYWLSKRSESGDGKVAQAPPH